MNRAAGSIVPLHEGEGRCHETKLTERGRCVCAALWLSSVASVSGQTAPAGPPMAEQVFKKIQRIAPQTDYEECREVTGVKMPVRWTVTWLDGRDVYEIKDVQPNVAIDAARFARPSAPR